MDAGFLQQTGKFGTGKIFNFKIGKEAFSFITSLLDEPFSKDAHIRVMPDVCGDETGIVGLTLKIKDEVEPTFIGVDIGCGMEVVGLGDVEIDFQKLDDIIRSIVNENNFTNDELEKFKKELPKKLKCYNKINLKNSLDQCGTLGSGNHFIEICQDGDKKYLIIHSGSRRFGSIVASHYIKLSKNKFNDIEFIKKEKEKIIKDLKKRKLEKTINQVLKKFDEQVKKDLQKQDTGFHYLSGVDMKDYLNDVFICQQFAQINRRLLSEGILKMMGLKEEFHFGTIHNYIDQKNVLRKGAISAKKDEIVIIPMNMRDGCLIAKGKGNRDWNESAPHGAGRIMSRREAKKVVDMEEFKKSMEGIFTTSVGEGTRDESPMVYKPMSEIVERIGDTVEIINHIKTVYNFKNSDTQLLHWKT